MKVRGKSISFSTYLKKKNTDKAREVEIKIKDCEDSIRKDFQNMDENLLSELSKHKLELQKIKEEETKWIQIRNRLLWYEEGEKPSKYFCNLENRNFVKELFSEA